MSLTQWMCNESSLSSHGKNRFTFSSKIYAIDNVKAAKRWVQTVRIKCARLADNPHMGVKKSEAGESVRMLVVGSYVVFYETSATEVQILRILHGARQWEDVL
jgi:toxin ParE1/3/4